MPRPRLSPQKRIVNLVTSINQLDCRLSLLKNLKIDYQQGKQITSNDIMSPTELNETYENIKRHRRKLVDTLRALAREGNETNLNGLSHEILETIKKHTGQLLKSLGEHYPTSLTNNGTINHLNGLPDVYKGIITILSHTILSGEQKKNLSLKIHAASQRKDFDSFLQQLPDQLFLDIKNMLEPHHKSEQNPYFSSTHAYDSRPPFEGKIISTGIHK